jgi:hypothetical protein
MSPKLIFHRLTSDEIIKLDSHNHDEKSFKKACAKLILEKYNEKKYKCCK